MKVVSSGFSAGKPPGVKPLMLPIANPAQLSAANKPLYPGDISRLEAPKAKRKYASTTRKVAFQIKPQAFAGGGMTL